MNIDSHTGAVGFIPRLLYPLAPAALVKVDQVTGKILRHKKTRRVIPCGINEPGELLGKIVVVRSIFTEKLSSWLKC